MTAPGLVTKLTVTAEYSDGTTDVMAVDVNGDGVRHKIDVSHERRDGFTVTTTDEQVSWRTVEYEDDPRYVQMLRGIGKR